jgi:hypothetical protein
MKTTNFNFTYCCGDKFKQIYRKLMATYRRQYAKKVRDEFVINFTEKLEEIPFVRARRHTIGMNRKFNLKLCPKCYKMYYNDLKTINCNQYNVKMEIIHGN